MRYIATCETCSDTIDVNLENLLYMACGKDEFLKFFYKHNGHKVRCRFESDLRTPYQFGEEILNEMVRFLFYYRGNKPLVGVEIGTGEGNSAFGVLYTLNIKKLYLIDPYELFETDPNRVEVMKGISEKAKKNLSVYNDKIEYIKLRSSDAVNLIPEDVDFIYIDGDHSFKSVNEDIRLYYPKLKKSGVMGGDDFSPKFHGVARAVINFTDELNLPIRGRNKLWWIIKPPVIGLKDYEEKFSN